LKAFLIFLLEIRRCFCWPVFFFFFFFV
jgi:hypothetical protein